MAGSFGFEKEKYDVSMKVGELSLLPAARACPPDTLLVADGFSCREQIEQGAGKVPLHIAQVARLGLDASKLPRRPRRLRARRAAIATGVAAAALGAILLARSA